MKFENLLTKNFDDIIGQETVKKQLKSALLSERNIILVGAPGIGKTTLAKNVSKLMPKHDEKIAPFIRVQGSPDLTAEDLLGDIDPIKALKFGPTSKEAFTPGKIFEANNGVLFFDEVNRCSEKLQNTLLQALEEKKVTIGSYKVDFEANFVFIGTMNPEDSSTEPLSDVFLDRFDLIYMDYPETLDIEKAIVLKSGKSMLEFPEVLLNGCLRFIRNLREDENVEKKPSVRASIGIYERAQTNAILSNRKQVTIEDITAVIISVVSHRIRLRPSIKYLKKPETYVKEEFDKYINREKGGFL
ncbi:MAG: MoxR family ATPase [Nanoarchaeota archaeon]|nr:MoxR family ATPase [Nanoarchaeota archaeon]MBU1269499.1 MoxR family ATPase [Nanoarchaeota archaeon]MBU1603890.1 MoxR family ATPase [Nanoarchaeota archaeon]MBU2443338.1 MoxR family ATPase [Nanoarchaeota archaeon]